MRLSLSRQLLMFLLVGAIQLLIDTGVFIASSSLGLTVPAANVLGRLIGACAGYWLNGRFTFSQRGQSSLSGRSLRRFIVAWLALTFLSTLCVGAIAAQASLGWAWLAKPAVEALMAAIGFVVWRQWVYR